MVIINPFQVVIHLVLNLVMQWVVDLLMEIHLLVILPSLQMVVLEDSTIKDLYLAFLPTIPLMALMEDRNGNQLQ